MPSKYLLVVDLCAWNTTSLLHPARKACTLVLLSRKLGEGAPEEDSGRHSIMVLSMEADSRQGVADSAA